MSTAHTIEQKIRSNSDLAQLIVEVAGTAHADTILCITEAGRVARHIHRRADRFRFIAATTNGETYDALTDGGMDVLRLAVRTADRYRQIDHLLSVALREGLVAIGDFVVCSIGKNFYEETGSLVVLTEVEPEVKHLVVSDLLQLTDAIRPEVLEATIALACRIGRVARRGKGLGAIFMLGDSVAVLEGSRQLVPNPFQGHDEQNRWITESALHDALLELAKLDGAFVIRGDGFIQAGGVFLTSPDVETEVDVPAGLGSRHVTAAAVTARTSATAIVVSATDGHVRAFSGGTMVLQIDPEAVQEFLTSDESASSLA